MKSTFFRSTMVKVSICILIVVSAVLIFYFTGAASMFLDDLELNTRDMITDVANTTAQEIDTIINRRLSSYISDLAFLNTVDSYEEARAFLSDYLYEERTDSEANGIVSVRYFIDGIEYHGDSSFGYRHYVAAEDEDPNDYYTEDPLVTKLALSGATGCTSKISDDETNTGKCMAFCIQTPQCKFIDCVVVIVRMQLLFEKIDDFKPVAEVSDETDSSEASENTTSYEEAQPFELACLAADTGTVIMQQLSDVFTRFDNTINLIELLTQATNDKETIDRLEITVGKGETASAVMSISGESYAIAMAPVKVDSGTLYVAEVYAPSVIFSGSYSFVSKLGGAVSMLCLIFIIMAGVIIAIRGYYQRKLYKSDSIDPILGCRSFKKFTIDTEDLISINRTSAYAMVYIVVENYSYIKATYGETVTTEALKYVGKVLDKMTTKNETYSHISDEKFSLLVRYNISEDIITRLTVLNSIVVKFPELRKDNYDIQLGCGIYLITRKDGNTVQPLLEKAMLAQRVKTRSANKIYQFYRTELGEQEARERAMEGKMDSAVKNNDFKVFYQPKLNIRSGKLDGAEALVRWFDSRTNSYIYPDMFIPLFERNGFISILDTYVYEQVCKYIQMTVAEGHRLVPISVNVSRVTAMQEGFIERYIAIKKKYAVSDNYIMIEFTESFAQENYDALRDIIFKLRSHGFKCSIDDFGSGYSSYGILKELPMDELKLDQFFIRKGLDTAKDDILLQSVIKLANDLGMKTTQEGVESWDDLKRLKDLNCEVIQGYYYSMPLPLNEYIDFVTNHINVKEDFLINRPATERKDYPPVFDGSKPE